MGNAGYPEDQLVANRTAVLLFGGTEADRRAWAGEAAAGFAAEGPLLEVESVAALPSALQRSRGVVFVPDLGGLGLEAQAKIVRCLIESEERPKLVLALQYGPDHARGKGLLREDLAYRLEKAQVDLSDPALKEAIRGRRLKAEKRKAAVPPKPGAAGIRKPNKG